MHAGAACRFSPSPPPPCPVFCNVFGGGWFFSCFFLARECREKRNSARCTWWLSSVLGKDWDVGWQGRARSPPPYIAILPPGSHWQWCNPSWSSPSWSWPTQVEGHHGQGGRFWFFGILVVLSLGCSGHRPLCRPMKVSRISKRPEIVVTFMGTLTVLHRPRVPDPGGARAGWGRAAFPHWFCMYSCPAPPASQCITPMPIYHNIDAVPLIVASVALLHRTGPLLSGRSHRRTGR